MAGLADLRDRVEKQTAAALSLVGQLTTVDGVPRQYIAELIAVRTFSLFETVVEESACQFICGASYCDGTRPTLRRERPTKGFRNALVAMRIFGRTEPRLLRWNKPGEIASNMEHLFPSTEHFVASLKGHASFVADLRKIRNHIAHGNPGTRRGFQEVVYNRYGARVGVTPGQLLLSSRFSPTLIETLCRQNSIILKTAIRA